MKTSSYVALMMGAGIFALIALSAEQPYAQANNPNAHPNRKRPAEAALFGR